MSENRHALLLMGQALSFGNALLEKPCIQPIGLAEAEASLGA